MLMLAEGRCFVSELFSPFLPHPLQDSAALISLFCLSSSSFSSSTTTWRCRRQQYLFLFHIRSTRFYRSNSLSLTVSLKGPCPTPCSILTHSLHQDRQERPTFPWTTERDNFIVGLIEFIYSYNKTSAYILAIIKR